MKKIMILLAVAGLIFVSCGNKTQPVVEQAEETCDTLTPEQQEMFANWDMWADLNAEQQELLVVDMKTFLDECKAKCEAKCEGKEEAEEVCPEKAAKCAEFKAKWENFDNLSLDEKKALIDELLACKEECCKEKEKCCKEKAAE
jgi:hypothetical protein